MAKSKYEYVKKFETDDSCLPNCWIVIRVDGKCFHRFADCHKFNKPNDSRALSLMTRAAHCVMDELSDVILAYGESDEYSFVFRRCTDLYNRRASKLVSTVVSIFTSAYVFYWPQSLIDVTLQYPPSFDGRLVLYPSVENLRDYLSWRQVDCHINNLYNTCYWALLSQGDGQTPAETEKYLRTTNSADKNELLFSKFGINYNDLPDLYRKGTTLVRELVAPGSNPSVTSKKGGKYEISEYHVDIIREQFWNDRPYLLGK